METKFGVHSEVGQLRKVMVCAPGRAHQRLTPSNCDDLLFDDVLWVDNAKRDHFDFMTKMRDRGVDVAGDAQSSGRDGRGPRSKEMDSRQPGDRQSGRDRSRRRGALLSRRPEGSRSRRDADRRPVDPGISRPYRRRDAGAGARRSRRQRISAAAAPQHALHPRHDLLDLWRRDAEPALLAGAARGDDPHHLDLQVPSRLRRQGQCVVGRSRPKTGGLRRSKAATSCRSARAMC